MKKQQTATMGFGKKVDLVELSTLKPQLKANILKEQMVIYG